MTRVIGVVSGKGGVGKTTLVSNVGTILAQHFGRDVTIVDCNVTTAHLGMYMGVFFMPVTLNNVLKGEAAIDDAVYKLASGVKIVPASLNLADLQGIDILQLGETIKGLIGRTEMILLDAAPGLGKEAVAAINASEEILFITTPSLPCVADIVKCRDVAEDAGKKCLGIVVNMVTGKETELRKEEVEDITALPVLASIPYDKNVRYSTDLASPIFVLNEKARASRELLKFSASLIGVPYTESFLTRIFARLRVW